MQILVVTVCASNLVRELDAHRDGSTADLVILSLMAIDAAEIQSPHMHIEIRRGVDQVSVQIAMLDSVAASAGEVAASTAFSGGNTHIL